MKKTTEFIKTNYTKYREIIIYLVVGVLTTIVSWLACLLSKTLLNPEIAIQNNIINTIGWIAGVCFAYPLNRKWVFKSNNPRIMKEFIAFVSSRISTWITELVVMTVCVNIFHFEYWIAKILIAAVLVTVLNYIFSKIFIFKKKK